MSLPSTVAFTALQTDYIPQLNQLITDINALNDAFNLTQSGSLFSDTSATSWTIGAGSKAFTLASGSQRAFQIGQTVRVAYTTTPTNYGTGTVTAYSHPTLTVNITAEAHPSGTGPYTAWSIGLDVAAGAITSLGVGTATASQFITVNSAGTAIVGLAAPDFGFSDTAFWMGAL